MDFKNIPAGTWADAYSAPEGHQGGSDNAGIQATEDWEQGDSGLTQSVKVKAGESIFFHYNAPWKPKTFVKFSWTVT